MRRILKPYMPGTLITRRLAPLKLWWILRVVSACVGSLAFYLDPPAKVLDENQFLAPWYAWDAEYFARAVRDGFSAYDGTANFHPLFQWLSSLLLPMVREPMIALLLVSSLASIGFVALFYRLARLDYDTEQSALASYLMLCWPASLVLFLPYTESLFLLLSAAGLLACRWRRFWIAGLMGCLASLTRQQGIVLSLPIAWEMWEASGHNLRTLIRSRTIALSLPFVGYGLWILYRAFAIKDVRPNVSSVHGFIYSVMLSPSTTHFLKDQEFVFPWTLAYRVIRLVLNGEAPWQVYGELIFAIAFLVVFVVSWRFMRTSYRLFSLAMVLISLSFYTGAIDPVISLPRHLLLAFPVFMGFTAAYKLKSPRFILTVLYLVQLAWLARFVSLKWVV